MELIKSCSVCNKKTPTILSHCTNYVCSLVHLLYVCMLRTLLKSYTEAVSLLKNAHINDILHIACQSWFQDVLPNHIHQAQLAQGVLRDQISTDCQMYTIEMPQNPFCRLSHIPVFSALYIFFQNINSFLQPLLLYQGFSIPQQLLIEIKSLPHCYIYCSLGVVQPLIDLLLKIHAQSEVINCQIRIAQIIFEIMLFLYILYVREALCC